MTTLREAAQQALDALNLVSDEGESKFPATIQGAISDLEAALAQQAEPVEPVAYIHRQGNHWEVSERHLDEDEKARGWTEEPLYTAPPQRKPLTDEEIERLWYPSTVIAEPGKRRVAFGRAVERAHGIGEGA